MPCLDFFLKAVQNVDRRLKPHRVNGPVGVSIEIVDQLHCTAAQAPNRLRRWWMLAGLRKKQLESEVVLNLRGKFQVFLTARPYPD